MQTIHLDQVPHVTVFINSAGIATSSSSDCVDLCATERHDIAANGRNTINGGSPVAAATISVDPTGSFAIKTPLSVDGDDDEAGSDGLEDQSPSTSDEHDDVSDRGNRCRGNCCSRSCSKFWRERRTACRTCAAGSRQFVEEVGELIGEMELRRRVKRFFTLKTIMDWLPVTKWLPKYRSIPSVDAVSAIVT